MASIILAEPSILFGGVEILLILAVILTIVSGASLLTAYVVKRLQTPRPPSAPPEFPPATERFPRKCPQCGSELKADVPEGLCPACLLQRGIATEGGIPAGQQPFVPPTIVELAKLFPQLEIIEPIGKGGMGAVYKARQPALDRFVALKILAPRPGNELDFGSRFSREAKALARLNHPNIVAVYDFGVVSGAASDQAGPSGHRPDAASLSYFIMEYVDGPNLRQVQQAGKLAPREALEIIPQICAALQFAHDEGIVHRDIKPENVLLDKKGRVKIADFGLAKILGQEAKDFRLTGAKDVMGTPHYMAPEQVEKPQEVDHRADIFSLGVVFYEMLTGELPLGKFSPPSQKVRVDVRLDEVVLRALEKEPGRRYQRVSEVGTQVENIAGNPQAAKAPPVFSPPTAPIQSGGARRGLRVGAVIFACVTALLIIATLLLPKIYQGTAKVKVIGGIDPDVRARAAADAMSSSEVLDQVATEMSLRERWGKKYAGDKSLNGDEVLELLKRAISIEIFPGGITIQIKSFSDSRQEAAEIANRIAQVYCQTHPDAHIIDRALVPSQPVKPNIPLNIALAVLIGLLAGAVVGFIVAMYSLWKAAASKGQMASPPDRFWRRFAIVIAAIVFIPVAIGIVAFIAAIAVPHFAKARQKVEVARQRQTLEERERSAQARAGMIRSDYIGKTFFPRGDAIEIASVERTRNRMTVKGRYSLVSTGNAHLGLYFTSSNAPSANDSKSQWMEISNGEGAFALIHSNSVSGLPHVSMYAGLKSFATVYFGTEEEVRAESALDLESDYANRNSAEAWSPTPPDGEKPDLQKIREEAKSLMNQGRYDEALQRQLWYFHHAREYGEVDAVRLSFGLADWTELGRRYPKAKEALVDIRDRDVKEFTEGRGYSELFQEVQNLNRELQQEDATCALFKDIQQHDKTLARQCYFYVEDLLADKGEYELCARYLGDPQQRFESARSGYQMEIDSQRRMTEIQQRTRQQTEEMYGRNGWTNRPAMPPDTSKTLKSSAENRFVGKVRQLIEILVATDRHSTAERIQAQAVATLDDDRLKSAVNDARKRTGKPAALVAPAPPTAFPPPAIIALPLRSSPEAVERDLAARLASAKEITSFMEKDSAMAAIARDAATAGNAAIAKQALGQITAFTTRDDASRLAARRLAESGHRAEALAIARSITSFVTRDAALRELADK